MKKISAAILDFASSITDTLSEDEPIDVRRGYLGETWTVASWWGTVAVAMRLSRNLGIMRIGAPSPESTRAGRRPGRCPNWRKSTQQFSKPARSI